MKKIFFIILHPLRKLYWFIIRPQTRGVKGILFFENSVLMIRNSYGKGHWTMPGGRVKKNESPMEAVKREVWEEVGIKIETWVLFVTYEHRLEYKYDTVFCFQSTVSSPYFKIDPSEIREAKWFPCSSLPEQIAPNMQKFVVPFIQSYEKDRT